MIRTLTKVYLLLAFSIIGHLDLALAQKQNPRNRGAKTAKGSDKNILGPIEHQWPRVRKADYYKVDVDLRVSRKKFKRVVKGELANKNRFEKIMPFGVYRLTVTPYTKDGVKGKRLKRVLKKTPYPQVSPIEPLQNAYVHSQNQNVFVTFKWEKSPLVKKYLFRIKNINTGEKKEKTTTIGKLRISLKNNYDYEWQVRPFAATEPESPILWRSLTISKKKQKPTLKTPEITKKSKTTITWQAVAGASYYLVEIFVKRDEAFESIWKKNQRGKGIFLKNKIKEDLPHRLSVIAKGKEALPSKPLIYDFNQAKKEQEVEEEEEKPKEVILKKVKVVDDVLPPTEFTFDLIGTYGGETLDSAGVIGNFSGGGTTTGGFFEIEVLPEPTNNMIYLKIKGGMENFETVSATSVDNAAGESKTIETKRPMGHLAIAGRSNLSNHFYGAGVEISSHPFPKFVAENEVTGDGKVISESTVSLGAFMYHRTSFLGGLLRTFLTVSPLSSKARNFIAADLSSNLRWYIGDTFSITLGGYARYLNGAIQVDCSSNSEGNCTFPKATQTGGGGHLGLGLTF